MTTASNVDELRCIAFPEDIDVVVEGLRQARSDWRTAHDRNAEHGARFPSRQSLKRIMRELGTALFPLRLGPSEITQANENAFIAASLESTLAQLGAQIGIELEYQAHNNSPEASPSADKIIGVFAANLPAIRRLLDSDVEAAYANDPAARSVDEVLVAYTSLIAIIYYRVAHLMYRLGAPLVARLISELAHSETGIDIHPGARIGRNFFVDHGTGLVIGETTVIGDRVRLFQGVTLGGDPDLANSKGKGHRHPVVEDDVVIHANATILGSVTIGAGSRIGGGVWLRQDVPPASRVEVAMPIIKPLRGADIAGVS